MRQKGLFRERSMNLKNMIEVTKNILKDIYKPRPAESRKYDYGFLQVIGGSEFYTGAPALAALAAFKSGVDMVRIIAPKRAADIIASFSPTLAAYPLKGDWLEKKHVSTLVSMIESAKIVSRGKTAVVIGNGLGRSEETQEAILDFLCQISVPAVIDVDAIYALARRKNILQRQDGRKFLITPHSREFYVLTGKEVHGLPLEEKVKIVQEEAKKIDATILLKGKVDVISNGKETAISKTGTAYMTKGGTGDTLAGICGSLLAQGIDLFTAAQAAAYINGRAGEIVSEKLKEGLTAADLIEAIPEALHK